MECVGGCTIPNNASACIGCKNYLCNETCVSSCLQCSSQNISDLGYLCIEEYECDGKTEMISPIREGAPVPVCVHCNGGNCSEGPCIGTNITSTNLGTALKDCTKVSGSLSITVAGGWNVTQQLEENLKQIKEVTGYIRIYGSKTLFSLNFLKNLEVIGGQEKVLGKYALYVLENDNLQQLWDFALRPKKLTIGNNGSIFFHYNPSLCPRLIYKLANLTGVSHLSPADVSNSTNGQNQPCYESDMKASAWAIDEVGSINITWEHIYHGNDNRFVIGYYIFYREASKNVTRFGGRDACNDKVLWERNFWEYKKESNRTVTVKGLKPFTRYALYVMAYYTDLEKKGSMSQILYVKTNPSEPSPVRYLEVTKATSNTLTLKWEAPSKPNGVISFYEIKYKEVKKPVGTRRNNKNMCFSRSEESPGVFVSSEVVSSHQPRNNPASQGEKKFSYIQNHSKQLDPSSSLTRQCCACKHENRYLYAHMMKEDRQFVIAFENYLDNILYFKVEEEDEEYNMTQGTSIWKGKNKISNEKKITSTVDVGAQHTRRKKIDSASEAAHPSVSNKSLTKVPAKQNSKPQHDETHHNSAVYVCQLVHNLTSISQDEVYRLCSANKSITLENLEYFTYYMVSVRACHAPENNQSLCSEWKNKANYTAPDISKNDILSFYVQETPTKVIQSEHTQRRILDNDAEKEKDGGPKFKVGSAIYTSSPKPSIANDLTSEVNHSSDVLLSSSTDNEISTSVSGSTLVLKWLPPKKPNGAPLQYIISVIDVNAGQGGKERGKECISAEKARQAGYTYKVHGFEPGKYNIAIQLMSEGTVGNPATETVEMQNTSIIWIVMGPLLSGILIGVCIMEVQVWLKKRRSGDTAGEQGNFVTCNGLYKELLGDTLENIQKKYILDREALQIDWETKLGEGCFGMVYQGVLSVSSGNEVKVAVKALNESESHPDAKKFLMEAICMQDINSNFVVQLLGVVANESPIYVVMELMERGDLKTFLRTEGGSTVNGEDTGIGA
ncbi:hypothetical protein SK128_024141 [Halocaridina rubra]|uniref:receptor protein-tyrosine kinase n=1 Tax=Halocaridina rubra TaxID=373956 RepID=A0AAN8ZUB1_HALRR